MKRFNLASPSPSLPCLTHKLFTSQPISLTTPRCFNRHDPAIEPNKGWDGDALQVRLCSDPKAPYPLPDMESDRICHLTMWFFTDKQLPVLHIAYNAFRSEKLWVGKESVVAFRKDKDGIGRVKGSRNFRCRAHAALLSTGMVNSSLSATSG